MSLAPPHRVILASAGTGKTFQLTSRFLALLAAGESPERILATTFTRKAAGEILRKIAARLVEGASSARMAAKLGEEIEAPDLRTGDCLRLLAALVRSLDRLSIGTIDSFFAKLAAGNALVIGGSDWRMIDEDEDANLRSEAVSRVLQTGRRAELLDLVRHSNPGQARSSVHADLLTAVDQAYSRFLASDRDAWGALAVPSGLNAADLARAIQALEAMVVPLTKAEEEKKHWRAAKDKSLAAAKAGKWEDFIGTGLAERLIEGGTTYDRVEIGPDVRGAMEPLLAHAAAALLETLPARTMATWEMLSRFDAAYREIKESRGLGTFDDVPRLLLEHAAMGSLEDVYYRLDARLHHILLDEFQDTSVVQWRLLKPMVDEIVSQGGDRSLLCVGDVKQSMYSWRQAEPELLASIPRSWPHIKQENLALSYRSSEVVIDAVNDVMGGLDANPALGGARSNVGVQRAAERWGGMFQLHTTKMDLPGFCRLNVSPEKTDSLPLKDGAVQAAAARVKEIHDAAPHLSIGVLFRGRALIAPMKLELTKLGIHASEEGGNPLADSPAVAAVLSMLTLVDHPGNTAALFHVAGSPLGPVVGLRYLPGTPNAARVAARVRLRILAEGFAGVLEDWVRRIAPSCSERDVRRLDQLVSLGVRFDERSERDPATRASAFVEFVKRRRVEDPTAAPVRLMTMHAAKGLEFHSVVLPWLADGIAVKAPSVLEERPNDNPLAPPTTVTLCPTRSLVAMHPGLTRMYERWRGREVLEELCVLYVALTRAIHSVEMFVPASKKSVFEDDAKSLTFAKILRGALNQDAASAGAVLWTQGDPAWAARVSRSGAAPTPRAKGAAKPPVIRLDLGDAARSRHLQRRSPSAPVEFVHAAWPGLEEGSQSTARARGILFHAWLERIEWLDAGPTPQDLFAIAATLGLPASLQVDRLAAEFQDALARAPLRELLARGSYPGAAVEVRREVPFSAAEGTGPGPAPLRSLVVGRIDRLVIVRDPRGVVQLADVIDFKTDQLDDASSTGVQLHAETYRAQMDDYRRTVSRLLGCAESVVKTKLVFLTHDAVVEC